MSKKCAMEVEIKALQKHMGGLVRTILDLKKKVETLENQVPKDQKDDIDKILEKQKKVEVAIAKNEEAILNIDKEMVKLVKKEQAVKQNDTTANKTSDKVVNAKQRKCRYFNRGFCKYKTKCRFFHPGSVCKEYLRSGTCAIGECNDRHPKACKWLANRDGCRRKETCEYLHATLAQGNHENGNFECISCKSAWKSSNCVKEHIIDNMRIFFCLNCEDWVSNKREVLSEGWTLLDEFGNLKENL